MAFIRFKKSGGKEYLYFVSSYRENGKVKQKQKYIRAAVPGDREKLKKANLLLKKSKSLSFRQQFDKTWEQLAKEVGQNPKNMKFWSSKKEHTRLQGNTLFLRATVKMLDWLQKNLPDPSCLISYKIKSSAKRGTLNPAMVYQLSRLRSDEERVNWYKYIKEKKIRNASKLQLLMQYFENPQDIENTKKSKSVI